MVQTQPKKLTFEEDLNYQKTGLKTPSTAEGFSKCVDVF
jgi:hypothetical protein